MVELDYLCHLRDEGSTTPILLAMRHITIGLSIIAILLTLTEPALASREGVPGRRVGGGTRWGHNKPTKSKVALFQGKVSALSFASRTNLPMALKLKAVYGA
jgi:hypothetical protein